MVGTLLVFLLSPGNTRRRTEQSSESVQETRHIAVTSVLRVTRETPAKASDVRAARKQ
jgi:hypothetical protein